ncbi:MAG: putative Actinobacterial Holin-X, holin superfamily [Myxococcales bacterium]|nr:putative Actinobacterial Holin-X, holin superfamily [Myxococcales bacterium]
MATHKRVTGDGPNFQDVVQNIVDDVKTIARDEVELARSELTRSSKTAVIDAAVILLGGIVALIGLGLLCVVVVAALAPVIPALWLRLLIMAVVYLAVGSAVAALFAKRLKRDAKPNLSLPLNEAKQTVKDLKAGLQG